MQRDKMIDKLSHETKWDLIVIGGGSSGLGVALEAVTRGLKTLLLESHDFAKGTSSRSTKLVHGGVRYLAQGNISLVLEALRERGIMKRNAPHLVHDKLFMIPSYKWWIKPYYSLGLGLYDFMSGKNALGRTISFGRDKALEYIPTLKRKKLNGGIIYHDGQFDDSRYAINLCQTFVSYQGVALNYMPVTDFIKLDSKVIGVKATDNETGKEFNLYAKYVVNATGVFVDTLLKKDNINAKKQLCVSQGVHLVFDKKIIPTDCALMIPKTSDGRVLFAVPWYNRVIVGTTDVKKETPELEPRALDEEINFILETANRFLETTLTRKDVKSVFAGLRPLASAGGKNDSSKEISRGHKILESKSGIVSIIGGKWTTYRKMGEDVINYIKKKNKLNVLTSISKDLHLHAYKENINLQEPLSFYGSDLEKIIDLKNNEFITGTISTILNISDVQLVWAVREEMVRSVEDFLARRTRALFLDARESINMAPMVAKIIALELDKDEAWEIKQVEKYKSLAKAYVLSE